MKQFPSTVVAGLLASVVLATVVPVFAASSSPDGSPQCGDEKKGGKGDEKPKAPSGL